MRRARSFGRGVYDFVVGDDPLVAAIVAIGLGTTAVLAHGGISAWWVLPCAVLAALGTSLRRASRR